MTYWLLLQWMVFSFYGINSTMNRSVWNEFLMNCIINFFNTFGCWSPGKYIVIYKLYKLWNIKLNTSIHVGFLLYWIQNYTMKNISLCEGVAQISIREWKLKYTSNLIQHLKEKNNQIKIQSSVSSWEGTINRNVQFFLEQYQMASFLPRFIFSLQ